MIYLFVNDIYLAPCNILQRVGKSLMYIVKLSYYFDEAELKFKWSFLNLSIVFWNSIVSDIMMHDCKSANGGLLWQE